MSGACEESIHTRNGQALQDETQKLTRKDLKTPPEKQASDKGGQETLFPYLDD